MLTEVVILGLLAGLCLGGSPRKLAEPRLHYVVLLILPVLISLLPRVPPLSAALARGGTAAAVTAAVVRYGLLVVFAALNRRVISLWIVAMGGVLNFLVTAVNGGAMPVARSVLGVSSGGADLRLLSQGEILNYRIISAATRLWPLGDVIRVRGIFVYFLSAGDILMAVGIFGLILQLMEPRRPVCLFGAKQRR